MVDSRFYERSPMRRLITLMMVVVVCVGVVVSPRVPSAGAAECKGTVSDLQWKPNSTIQNGIFVGNYGEGADVQFNWKVDSDANPGDQFTLKVPDELVRLGRKDLSLYSSDGQEVAKGTWNEGTKTWTFTLTDYARTHGDISGTAFFSVQWDRTKTTANTSYSLYFSGCQGGGTLNGKTPEEGIGGLEQTTWKTGVYDSVKDNVRWGVFVGTASDDVYSPVVIKDIGNPQLLIRCADVKVNDRTPYPHTAINDTPIDPKRWRCEESNGGITVRMVPDEYGRYLTRGQSLVVEFESVVTDDNARYITNKATVDNAPDDIKDVEAQVDRGDAGGVGQGFQGNIKIQKETVGDTAPDKSHKFEFDYTCGTSTQTVSVAAGETSDTFTQKSSSTCSITEKNVAAGVGVKFEVTDEGAGQPAYTVPTQNGVTVKFNKNSSTNLKVKVTNTYPNKPEAKKGKFVIKKTVNGLDAGQKDKVFKFNYTCKAPDGDADTEPQPAEVTAGKPWQSREYPEGTTCAIEEDLESAKVPGYSLISDQPKGNITIKADGEQGSPVEFAATNSYNKDLGSFSVQKKIDASAEAMPLLKDQEFGFKYTCGADNDEFKLKDGETKKVDGIAVGTKCTVEESDAEVPSGFMWSGKIEGPKKATSFEIEKDKTLAFIATNTYKQQHGGFTLSKNVTGDATNLEELQKRSYTFNYTCTAPTGTVLADKVEVTEGIPKAIGNIPAASTCKVTEVAAPVKDTDWTVDLSINGTSVGETAVFTVPAKDEPSISILAKNNYRQHKGTFTIEKIVDASEGIVTPKEFTFTWQCGEDKGAETVRVTNGKGRVEIDGAFPVGTKCSVKELEAEAEDARLITSWENQEFTIDKDKQHVIVSATNTYRYAESKVKIVKKLEGPAKDRAKDKTFTFDYSCVVNNEAIEGSVNITGEGATEIPESFPAGTKCTITERDASISGSTWTHRIAEDGQITIQSPARVYEVGVTNAYSKPGFPWFIPLIPLVIVPLLPLFPHPNPAPLPAPQPAPQKPSEQQPSPKAPEKKPQKEKKVLARTGANVWMFIVIAALLVLLGAFLRRRGNNS
ncbi:hypothetical protein I4J03_08470 [Corynebacterium diphtheriae bv. mitis]|uniref:DUF5979 domain-containing protein n=1 Tax=Corynebacterium diphtheriae TaxID=1717 RepID=UPI0018C9BE96|nr:DUF5979 domain-containing protein [Corynebacterium diphtheriae]MBG9253134.1 hypothetical protein [Corynebacterium diphtheriae bv. mitis]